MNDRFQFRVWKGKENRMVYNVTHLNPLLLDPRIDKKNVHNVPMQCVGLKDKNGKLIYEGDIVKTTLANEDISKQETVVFVVYWSNDEGMFAGKIVNQNNKKIFFIKEDYLYCLLGNEEDKTEVIGNIYENPDLLQECE